MEGGGRRGNGSGGGGMKGRKEPDKFDVKSEGELSEYVVLVPHRGWLHRHANATGARR